MTSTQRSNGRASPVPGPDGLTDRQRECLDFFRAYYACNGVPPTTREIMAAMGIVATNPVHEWLKVLVARGDLDVVRSARAAARYVPAGFRDRWHNAKWLRRQAAVLNRRAAELERLAKGAPK